MTMPRLTKSPPSRLLANALAACRTGLVAVAGFSLGINLLMLTAPLYMLQVFDRVISGRSVDTLLYLTLIAAVALVALALLEVTRTGLMVRLGVWLDQRLGGAVLEASLARGLARGEDASVQGLRDLSALRAFLTGPAVFPVLDSPWTPIFIAVIFLLHPTLGWLALAGAVVLLGFALANELATRGPLERANDASIKALDRAEAATRNADVVHSMGMAANVIGHWRRRNDETIALQARASRLSGGITAASKFFRMFLQIGLLGVGAWLVLAGELTPGAMIAASILMARALAPVDAAIASWRSVVGARHAYRRLKRLLAEAREDDPTMKLPAPKGRLGVEQLTYAHPGASEPTLRNIAFRLEPGESVGLIGPTAAGKTTLARLLVGNLAPFAGQVRLDGADVASWSRADLGPRLGYLPQDVELFSSTVRDNIARMGEGTPEAVIQAARQVGVHEMILALPDGYETEIGEGGAILSGGQRQRIALARAVFGDPSFVVLDEPNSSLDQEGDAALVQTMRALKKRGASLVIVTHRPSILRAVDKILLLEDGAVAMFGPREEVLPKVTGLAPAQAPGRPLTLDKRPLTVDKRMKSHA